MSLHVDAPEPPELQETNPNEYGDAEVIGDTDYRRDELEDFLHDGAWERAFNEWGEHADIGVVEFQIMMDLGLFKQFDFFWDSYADRVGFHAPGIPENWKEREIHPDLDSWNTVSGINAGLAEFGDTVSKVLKDGYIDWESDYDAPDDLPDF